MHTMQSIQGRCIKEGMGIRSPSHHSDLLRVGGINKAYDIVAQNSGSLWRRICSH